MTSLYMDLASEDSSAGRAHEGSRSEADRCTHLFEYYTTRVDSAPRTFSSLDKPDIDKIVLGAESSQRVEWSVVDGLAGLPVRQVITEYVAPVGRTFC